MGDPVDSARGEKLNVGAESRRKRIELVMPTGSLSTFIVLLEKRRTKTVRSLRVRKGGVGLLERC